MDEKVERSLQTIRTQTDRLEEIRRVEDEISAARSAEIVSLRVAGVSRDVIATAAGLTPARVTQILGRAGHARPVKPAKRVEQPVRMVSKPTSPEPHRHRFAAVAWNHRRGGYLLRQKCECGLTRVIPVPQLPKELGSRFADTSVVA